MAKISITKEAVDPFFNDVSLLLPFDGSFDDASNNNFTVTVNGNAQISSAESKFGGSSALFDGSGDYLRVSDNTAFNLASTPFTIEAWVYPTVVDTNTRTIIAKDTYGSNFSWCIVFTNTNLIFITKNAADQLYFPASLSANTWQHVAVTHDGSTTLRFFLNGTMLSTFTDIWDGNFNGTVSNASSDITIGCAGWNNPNSFFQGYIDNLRITKGIARYTANFTLPNKLSIKSKSGKLNIKRGGVDQFFNNVSLRKVNISKPA